MTNEGLVEGVAHVGVVVSDLEEALVFYGNGLGLEVARVETLQEQGITAALLRLAGGEIELIMPASPESGVTRFIEQRGEGMHHLAFETADVRAAFHLLKSKGIELLNEEPRLGLSGPVFFLHPRVLSGVLVEIEERDVAAAEEGHPSELEEKARLERITIAADDVTEAAAAWRQVLGLQLADREASGDATLLVAGETLLELRPGKGVKGLSALVMEIDDMEAMVTRLRESGFALSEVQVVGGVPTVDVDRASSHGVPIRLIERLE